MEKKTVDTLEAYYEKKSKRVCISKQEDVDADMVDPADVLPIKTLSGELHYRNTKFKAQLAKQGTSGKEEAILNLDERKGLVRKKRPTDTSPPPFKTSSIAGPLIHLEAKKQTKTKKQKQTVSTRAITSNPSITAIHASALEELKQDLSEEERVEETKARMAELGMAVLADPENNMDSLTELQGFCMDKDGKIARMAMLSLLTVFKDIVPGYRIRLPTEKELEMQVSKEVRKLRDFEARLLKCYQKYIQFLSKSIKSNSLWKPAVRCVCGLLEAIPHFNFCDSLLSVTIPLMDSADLDCRKMSCDAVRSLFQSEGKHGGSATVKAVEMIADFVKTENCILRPDVVQVLLSLSFDEDLNKQEPEREKEKGTDSRAEKVNFKHQDKDKKSKKRQLAAKLRDEVVADFRESCAMPEASERRRLQTQTLTAAFETYFRILKTSLEPVDGVRDTRCRTKKAEYGPRPLLRPCLDGLAKFSHLVSVEFMGDLLSILKRLAAGIVAGEGGETQSASPLSFMDQLQCCVVAFRIVRSNLDALNIDLREFYMSLYNLLLCHNFIRNEHDGLVLAEGLQVMFWESRQHDMQRVAAFVKRLAAESFHLGSAEAMSALVTVRHLLQRYRKCCNLLENEDGGGGVQVFQSEGADPDLSGALSSVLWEVSLLARHHHPAVGKLASQISNMLISREALQATMTPKEAVVVYSTNKGGFNPPVRPPQPKVKRKSYLISHHAASLEPFLVSGSMGTAAAQEADSMFLPFFRVARDIKQNQALRLQLTHTKRSLALFETFRARKLKPQGVVV